MKRRRRTLNPARDARFGRRTAKRIRGAKYPDLDAYIAATGDTQAAIAAHVGASQTYISRIRMGRSVPRAELAAKLAKYAGIPLDSFMRCWLRRQALEKTA